MNHSIKKISLLAGIVLLLGSMTVAASAKEKKRIAVLPFSTENVSPVTGKIVRDIIEVNLISSRRFTVIEREQMGAILKEQKIKPGACDETACAYQYGKALSIDYMVIGKVMKLKNFVVSLRLIDVRNRVVLSAEKLKSGSVEDLEDRAEELAEIFLDQLSSDNPRPRDLKIRQNRPGTITTTLFFNYTQNYSSGIQLPDNHGEPLSYDGRQKKYHGLGGGLSVAVALLPYLSLKGDISYVYSLKPKFNRDTQRYFSDSYLFLTSDVIDRYAPPVVSADFFAQFNYLFGPVMPFISLGIGYSYYKLEVENTYIDYNARIVVTSEATGDTDRYHFHVKGRSHIVSLVGDIGLTIFFDNTIGLTISCGLRYAPKQHFHKKVNLVKYDAGIAESDPILDIYQDLDKKFRVSGMEAQIVYNFKFGFTFRML